MSASAADLIDRVHEAGGRFVLLGGERLRVTAPEPLSPELMAQLRKNKPELLRLLAEPSEVRRRRVLDMLAKNPALRLAVVTSDDGGDFVTVTVGRRNAFGRGYTADLTVDRDRYDGVALLEAIERRAGKPWPETQGNA